MTINDQALVAFAQQAGLCLPHCWNLNAYFSTEDNEWAASAPTEPERQQRLSMVNNSRAFAAERIAELRRFAQLVLDSQSQT